MSVQCRPQFDHRPSGLGSPMERIGKIFPGEPQIWHVNSSAVCGVWTHYCGVRSFPCTSEDPASCFFRHESTSRRWCGWIACQRPHGKVTQWLCLSQAAGRDYPRLLDRGNSLRGCELRIGREGKTMHGRQRLTLTEPATDNRHLLREPSPYHFLFALWGPPGNWPVTFRNPSVDVDQFCRWYEQWKEELLLSTLRDRRQGPLN